MKFYCEELLPEIESMLLNEYKKNFFCRLINFKKIKLLDNINLAAKLKCWRQKTDINIYD